MTLTTAVANRTKKLTANAVPINDEKNIPKFDRIWYRVPHLFRLNLSIAVLLLASVTNGYTLGVANIVLLSPQWKNDFGELSIVKMNLVGSALGFGALTGIFLVKWALSEQIAQRDRNKTIIGGNLIIILGGLLQASCSDFWTFTASRFLCGLGAYLADNSSSALVSELAFPSHKEIVGMVYGALWAFGAVLGNAITYEREDSLYWRVPSAYQIILPVIQVFALLSGFAPSIKSLVAKGDLETCRKIIKDFHVGDSAPHESLVDYEIAQIAVDNQRKASKLRSLARSKSSYWLVMLSALVPFCCVHFGNGMLIGAVGETLDLQYGLGGTAQQICINGALFTYNVVSIAMKLLSPSISKNRLSALSLSITIIGVLGTVFVRGYSLNQFISYDDVTVTRALLVLSVLIHLVCLGVPPSLVSKSAPEHASRKLGAVMDATTTLSFLYNGFVNPWSMDRGVWNAYVGLASKILGHFVAFGLFVYAFRERSLHAWEDVRK
ncbi:hypothetical protein TRVA0_039S01332 [Trichomonascus vanleenenianus]|uniref:uncharacterized protein n=1 Tax=Trichomonascus vanleenenianus TaxID=2268995 RepID=UPI003ECABBA6